MMVVAFVVLAPPHSATAFKVADIRRIQRCLCTVRLRIGLLVVIYIGRGAWGPNGAHFFRLDSVSYLDNLFLNCHSQFFKPSIHLCLIQEALFKLVLDTVTH